MFELDKTIYFGLFISFVLILGLYTYFRIWHKKRTKLFADAHLWKQLSDNTSSRKEGIKLVSLLCILTVLIIALVNPLIGSKLKTVKREGVDIVFAIDVSKSMLAEDILPNRLEKSKRIVSELINELVSDRIGIVVYAGNAYPQLPLTTDYSSAKLFLKNVDSDLVPRQGTDLGSAIDMSLDYFKNVTEKKNQCILVFSDGEDHEAGTIEAAKRASEKGIIVNTIGVGTLGGKPIPIRKDGEIIGYKKDRNDQVVVTKLDAAVLQKIAALGDGSFIDGSDTEEAVEKIKDLLGDMEKNETETEQFSDYEDQFQWFLGIALIILFLDMLLSESKTKWIRKLNLFGDE